MTIKAGVLTFSYRNFQVFSQALAADGAYTTNLGDNMQSIAVRDLYRRLGVKDCDVISVDRDDLAAYAGPPVALIMNGLFSEWSFPLPDTVHPIFIGFSSGEATIVRNLAFLSRFQPIGCRDRETEQALLRHGVQAYVSGCLTLSIEVENSAAKPDRVLFIHGDGAGAMPPSLFAHVPWARLGRTEFVQQRLPVFSWPLDEAQRDHAERYARLLLAHYAKHARLVVTPLHHAAAPCLALGIPVLVCRDRMDSRFSYLAELMPIYTPATFASINWSPSGLSLEALKATQQQRVRSALQACGVLPHLSSHASSQVVATSRGAPPPAQLRHFAYELRRALARLRHARTVRQWMGILLDAVRILSDRVAAQTGLLWMLLAALITTMATWLIRG